MAYFFNGHGLVYIPTGRDRDRSVPDPIRPIQKRKSRGTRAKQEPCQDPCPNLDGRCLTK